MQKDVNIRQLVSLARNGDTDAFGKLYDAFLDAVYRFVYVRVGNREDAEDVTEQIFMNMFAAITRYVDDGLPFEAWMYRIARNKVIDHYRTRKQHAPLDAAAGIPDSTPQPEEHLLRTDSNTTVLNALRCIPPQYRDLIVLKFIEEKTNEEIGVVIRKPVAHVRVLQHRALRALRNALRQS